MMRGQVRRTHPTLLQAYKTGLQLTGTQSYEILSLDLPVITTGFYQVCGLLTRPESDPYNDANWLDWECRGFDFQ